MGLENLSSTAFGDVIRQAREKAGLTQKEFAGRCRINTGYLSRIERGGQPPGDKLSVRMAKILRLDPAKLFLFSLVLGVKPEFRQYLLKLPDFLKDGSFDI